MRRAAIRYHLLFFWGASLALPLVAQQSSQMHSPGRLEVALTYDTMRSNVVNDTTFWLQGGSVQVHGQFWRGLGAVADVGGLHEGNINSSGVGLDLITATFGARYTWAVGSERSRYSIYGQGLAGVASGRNSVFPNAAGAQNTATGFAVQAGGGLNMTLSSHMLLRAFEANWVHTDLPNGTNNTQNNLRMGGGITFRF